MHDLESFYDRHLPRIGVTVEEHIGANREAIKLTTTVLPHYDNLIGTTHSKAKLVAVDKMNHREEKDKEMCVSDIACKDDSCVASKEL